MILDELVLHNVGVFSGYHRLTLTPPSPSKPIVLIGGMNGAGKTTIRDALYLALYGPLAEGSSRRSGSYEQYLRSLISRDKPAHQGSTIELAFHAHREGERHAYRICRSWQASGSGVKEQLSVLRDGHQDRALAATWAEQVEAFLPRGIAGLFFFDGEQIESMADLERSKEVLSSALAALLGLDLVDRLDTDLAVLRRRHRTSTLPDDMRQRLAEAQAVMTLARQTEENLGLAVATARVDLEQAGKREFASTERYRAAGGDLLAEREQIETRVIELRAELGRIDLELKDVAAGAVPLFFVAEELGALAERSEREAVGARGRLLVEVLEGRDQQIIEMLRSAKARTATVDRLDVFLTNDRQRHREEAGIESITGLTSSEGARYLFDRVLPDARSTLRKVLDRRAETTSALEAVERLVAAIPDPEALRPLQEERDAALGERLQAEATLAHIQERQVAAASDRSRAEAAYEKVLDEAAAAGLLADDNRRLVDHVDRVRKTLDAFKAEATRRHVDRIGSLVLESLTRLLRKENLITDVRIDPATFEVELRGHDGRTLSSEVLSAGERQLLAVALLWGLARASGQPLPVVIDTPLGRLDSSHRNLLLTRYFPHVSHQVLLLSTDTEIDEPAHRRIRNYVGHAYRLDFDPAVAVTTLAPGYFWESN